MREPVKDPGRLLHMVQAIDRILEFVKGKTKDEIQRDNILYYAVVKNVEIIGEAAYMLTKEFKESHPETNWRIIIGMRHFLVHGYYEVDPNEVWNVIDKDLLPLKEQLEKYLKEF